MTLQWIEGFESLTTTISGNDAVSTDIEDKYQVSSIAGIITAGRRIGSCWKATDSYIETPALTDDDGWVVGFGIRFDSLTYTGSQSNFLECYDGTTLQMALAYNGDGTIIIKRGSTTLATTVAAVSTTNWYYFEFKFTINNTNGSYELVWDNVSRASGNADTQEGSNANVDRFRFLLIDDTAAYFDDIYILNITAGVQNNFLALDEFGLVVESADFEGDGFYSDWASSELTDYEAVGVQSLTTQDDSHLRSNTSSDKVTLNTYTPPNLDENWIGIQLNIRCRNLNTNDQHQITPMTRNNSIDYFMTGHTDTIDWPDDEFREIYGTAQVTTIDTSEVGFRLES